MKIKRVLLISLFYITLLITLTILGVSGNDDKKDMAYALRYFKPSDIEAGASYFLHGLVPSTLYRLAVFIFLIAAVIMNWFQKPARFISSRVKNSFLNILISLSLVLFAISLLRFPFSIYAGFYRDKLFGLTDIDFSLWASRYAAKTIISIFISAFFLTAVLMLIKKTKKYILYIPTLFLIFSISVSIVYPRFITPLFYKTYKLENSTLKKRLVKLTKKAGMDIDDIYVIEKSPYTHSVNAMLVGTGKTRKILLYDTLLKKFGTEEVLSVTAHEIAHYKEEHMLIGILLGSIGLLLIIPIYDFLLRYFFGKSIKEMGDPVNIPLFLVTLSLLVFFTNPLNNYVSRRIEARADRFAIRLTENPKVFINMQKGISIANRSNLLPNPVFTFFYNTHPPILERIKNAEKYVKK